MAKIIYPTPIGYDAFVVSWMVGRAIADITFHEPAQWRFVFGPGEHLAVECLWRLVRAGQIVLTNQDHGQLFGLSAPIDAA